MVALVLTGLALVVILSVLAVCVVLYRGHTDAGRWSQVANRRTNGGKFVSGKDRN